MEENCTCSTKSLAGRGLTDTVTFRSFVLNQHKCSLVSLPKEDEAEISVSPSKVSDMSSQEIVYCVSGGKKEPSSIFLVYITRGHHSSRLSRLVFLAA